MRRSFVFALVIATGTATGSKVKADVLADLIAHNGSITIVEAPGSPAYEKVFSHFGYVANSGQAPAASDITVNEIPPSGTDSLGNPGIRFGLAGLNNPGGAPTDFHISFEVDAYNADHKLVNVITDVHLGSNLSLAGNPVSTDPAFGNIVESVTTPGSGNVLTIQTFATPTSTVNTASANLAPTLPSPVSTLFITKDVLLSSSVNARTSLSYIDQSFSQTSSVPEPSVMVLAGVAGIFALGGVYRKRQYAKLAG